MKVPSNYEEARAAADAARDRANKIRQETIAAIMFAIAQDTPNGRRWATENFNVLVQRKVSTNEQWKAAVAENQWMIQYATMYAQGEILKELRRAIAFNPPTYGESVDPA